MYRERERERETEFHIWNRLEHCSSQKWHIRKSVCVVFH